MKQVQKRMLSLVVLFTVGVLAGLLVFWQREQESSEEEKEKEERRVLSIRDASNVTSVELTTPEKTYVLERAKAKSGESTWRIVEPTQVPAEDSTVEAMIQHLVGLEHERVLDEKAYQKEGGSKGLWLFGLEPPRFEVKLTAGEHGSETLHVGKRNSFDGSIYVKRADDDRVMQVEGALEYQVDKDLYNLRDKRLVGFETDALEKLVVHIDDKQGYTLERVDGVLRIAQPVQEAADEAQVNGLVSALSNMRASEFVAENATSEDLVKHGLKEPAARAELFVKGRKEPYQLLFSRQAVADETDYFAGRGEGEPILKLSSDWVLRKLQTDVQTLRDKHVARFDRDAVQTIVVKNDERTLELSRAATEGSEATWRILEPEAQDAQDSIVTGLLYRLWNLKSREIVDEQASEEELEEYGLAEPQVSIRLLGDDEEELATIALSAARDGVKFATSSTTGRIDKVDELATGELSANPEDYQPDEEE